MSDAHDTPNGESMETIEGGRELDAAVAVEVLGFQWWRIIHRNKRILFGAGHIPDSRLYEPYNEAEPCALDNGYDDHVRAYSWGSNHYWTEVFAKAESIGFEIQISSRRVGGERAYACTVLEGNECAGAGFSARLPTAVCRAVLAAVQVREGRASQ
jgi:hypothetical protein